MTAQPSVKLRDYQLRDLEAVRAAMRQYRSVLLRQPCGAGKGTLASFITHSAAVRGKRIIFLVNRRALVHDMADRLKRLGVPHGVIMGNDPRRAPWQPVHVASVDTLHRRQHVPKADLLIIDECRFAISPIWRKVVDRYPDAKILGLDATPTRTDNRGLGEMFDYMVQGPSVEELIAKGHLVRSRTFAGKSPDTSNVRHTGGEFNEQALAAVCDQKKLIGDIVDNWKLLSPGRKTVAFGVNKSHASNIAEQFRCAGVNFAYVDDKTSDDERKKIWDDLDYGQLLGIASIGVIGFGWDHPIVSTVIQGRPTESLSVDIQQIGRGSRPYKDKDFFLVLDHASNYTRHGFYEDPRTWSLEGEAVSAGDREASVRVTYCRQCFGTFRTGPTICPYCGAPIVAEERKVIVEEGQLEEVRPRMVCDACRREMPGAAAGDPCAGVSEWGEFGEIGVGLPYGACPGVARRAYEVRALHADPEIAALQKTAAERAYKSGWVWLRLKDLARQRGHSEGWVYKVMKEMKQGNSAAM